MERMPEKSQIPLEEYNRRLDICDSCEYHNHKWFPAYPNPENKPLKSCEFCGCYMPQKACYPDSTCPKNRW